MNRIDQFELSRQNPDVFWGLQAERIKWYVKPKTISSLSPNGLTNWYQDGWVNICYLAVDQHIEEGRGNETALIYDSPVTQTQKSYTYLEMQAEISCLAGGLRKMGVEKGDVVMVYMPMIPQAVFAMLACARIGATHSVVFGGFAANELAIRIDDCAPKAIITASSGIEIDRLIPYKPLVDEAIMKSQHKPDFVVVFNRRLGAQRPDKLYDIDYTTLVRVAEPVSCLPVPSGHSLYILYTSGTTGKPKGIVRDHGGYAVALHYSMEHIYGLKRSDTFWAASDVGWVVGHSYIVYAPLVYGCKTIVYEGKPVKTPNAGSFWRVINEHQVSVFFTAPTAIRAIRQEDPNGLQCSLYDLNSLKAMFLAGERCDSATLEWAKSLIRKPVIDHWWQTESGWPMLANMLGIQEEEIPTGSAGKPVPGFNIEILQPNKSACQTMEEGLVVIKLPLPPGTLTGIWGNDERLRKGYLDAFDGYYLSGDGGYTDQLGNVFITGRVDDVINVAGHRLSTAEMEEVVSGLSEVAECCVVGAADALKGQVPIALYTLKLGVEREKSAIEQDIVRAIRNEIGPVASLKTAICVKRLPKTRSGKILRRLIRSVLDGEDYTLPSTIDDPQIPTEIKTEVELYFNQNTNQIN